MDRAKDIDSHDSDTTSLYSSARPQITRLHDIALQLIFDELFSPFDAAFLNISIHSMLNRPWTIKLKLKKSLVLVCKHFYALALPYLYSDICLRYVGQIPALVRTVRSNPVLFAPLVHKLRITCYIPDEFVRLSISGIQYLLDTCPSLRDVAFEEALIVPKARPRTLFSQFTDKARSLRLPATVEKVTLATHWIISPIFEDAEEIADSPAPVLLISTLPNLIALNMNALFLNTEAPAGFETLHLPRLESLRVFLAPSSSPPDRWTMPRLRSFSVRRRWFGGADYALNISTYMRLIRFLVAHGSKLNYVDYGCNMMDWTVIDSTFDHCPQLHHLVFTLPTVTSLRTEPFRGIPFVDIFSSKWESLLSVTKHVLHMFSNVKKNIRFLDRALLDIVPDLPTLLPPGEELIEGMRTVDLGDLVIQQSNEAIWLSNLLEGDTNESTFRFWRSRVENSELEWEAEIEQDDISSWSETEEYVNNRSTEYSDSDSEETDEESASDDIEADMQELREEVRWCRSEQAVSTEQEFWNMQIDEEQALVIFSETLLLADD